MTCCSMADANDRAFTCVSGAVAERCFVYMAMANPNFESVSFSVQRDAGSDGSLTAEKLEGPVALGSFSHSLMKKMNAQNWGGGGAMMARPRLQDPGSMTRKQVLHLSHPVRGGREVSQVLSPQPSQVKGFGAGVSLAQEASPSMNPGNESGHGPSFWMNSVKTHIGRFF